MRPKDRRDPAIQVIGKGGLLRGCFHVRINEDDFFGLHKDLPAKVRFYSYGSQLFHGKVSQILPEADPSSQEYTIHLELETGGKTLLAGMSGEASIILGEAPDSTVVPRRALLGGHVFVVKGNQVERRTVRVGFSGLNKVQILEGLQPREKVVVENLDLVRDGGLVRVK